MERGRYDTRSRTCASASSSSSQAPCTTPDRAVCTRAPPSSSWVTSSCVTDRITSGPVRNMLDVPRLMKMKSVSAGEYTAPPAQGPRITESWGMTPDAATFRWKTSAYPARESTPSWIRAPPESLRPITGTPSSTARSRSRQIFAACASLRLPPSTVKSWLKAITGRPHTVPLPVTTPSPGYTFSPIPKSVHL